MDASADDGDPSLIARDVQIELALAARLLGLPYSYDSHGGGKQYRLFDVAQRLASAEHASAEHLAFSLPRAITGLKSVQQVLCMVAPTPCGVFTPFCVN